MGSADRHHMTQVTSKETRATVAPEVRRAGRKTAGACGSAMKVQTCGLQSRTEAGLESGTWPVIT